jgi:hypothetical protein
MSLGSGNLLLASAGDAGYNFTRSLRFRASASGYLNRSAYPVASAGTQWTMSMWVKRGTLGTLVSLFSFVGTGGAAQQAGIQFDSNNNIRWWQYAPSAYQFHKITTAVFRDPSAWYQLVFIYDTTLATASDRCQIWVNGVRQTSFSTSIDPSASLVTYYKTGQYFPYLGAENRDNAYFGGFDGYLAEVNFIDGQALTPSSFGSTNALTGVWQPARYTGSYGTNGFYLPFTDNSALTTSSNVGLGKDFSGNGNYWTTNNISITAGVTYDSMTDVPTLTSATAANFAVLNPLSKGSTITVQAANLRTTIGTTHNGVLGSMQLPTSGKWYWEVVIGTTTGSNNVASFGVATAAASMNTYDYNTTGTYSLYLSTNLQLIINGSLGSVWGSATSSGTVCGVAYDANNGQLYLAVSNTYYNSAGSGTGNPAGGTNSSMAVAASLGLFPYVHLYDATADINFGQRPFTYTPPTGFVALNCYNLPTSTIVKGNSVMDATLWAGTDVTPQAITNAAAFKPDLVWVKNRTTSGFWNVWFDSVRGAGNQLSSNQTDAELASASSVAGKVSAFNSNGFSLSAGSSNSSSVNGIGGNYVGWQWQAGQGSTSSNTNGTITSTVSVNASAGFSVVTYTGDRSSTPQTVGHGLGVAPAFIIFKSRNNASQWLAYHQSLGNTKAVYPNLTDAAFTTSGFFNNTSPTSSVFTINTANENNGNAYTMVAYCWAPIAGYSSFGSYTGNGSADGTFVYTGFRPKFVIIKRTDAVGDWYTFDTSRDPYNATAQGLSPNSSAAETSYTGWGDLLSNGFKIRRTDGAWNASGGTYIYMAFAESPFRNALAR